MRNQSPGKMLNLKLAALAGIATLGLAGAAHADRLELHGRGGHSTVMEVPRPDLNMNIPLEACGITFYVNQHVIDILDEWVGPQNGGGALVRRFDDNSIETLCRWGGW